MPLDTLVTLRLGCLALPTIGYSLAIHRILATNWSTLRPCHVVQANYLAALLAVLVHSMFLVTVRNLLDLSGQICSYQALGLFLRVFHNFALALMQADRLLAVQWPFLSLELTVANSLQAVLATITTVLVITVVAVGVDPAFRQCQECHVCLFLRPVNLFAVTVPFFVALALTLLVSARLMLEVHRMATPSPPLHLILPTPSVRASPTSPPRLLLSASVFSTPPLPLLIHPASNTPNPPQPLNIAPIPGPSALRPRNQKANILTVAQISQIQPLEGEPTLPPVEVEPRVRVLPHAETPLNNPSNTAIRLTGQQELNSQESQTTIFLELLKKDIKMNLVTILLLISYLPRQVTLLGQYQPCYLEGDCEELRDAMRWYFLLYVVVMCVHTAAILLIVKS